MKTREQPHKSGFKSVRKSKIWKGTKFAPPSDIFKFETSGTDMPTMPLNLGDLLTCADYERS